MTTYNLELVSPEGFQDLSAALLKSAFGQGIRKLGPGRDGGRDLEFHGDLVWTRSGDDVGERWQGWTVFQVKQKRRPSGDKSDLTWLWSQIREELDNWARLTTSRPRVPDHLVFVTNLRLSPSMPDGRLAKIESNIEDWFATLNQPTEPEAAERTRQAMSGRMRRVKTWKVVDGNDLDGWLDTYGSVRNGFRAFLTTGDVLGELLQDAGHILPADLEPSLREHSRSSLIRERMVYFDEAGGSGAGVPVDSIAIDLPMHVHNTDEKTKAFKFALEHSEHVLRPSISTVKKPRHIVITGAPGNGKTTVSKFLVQAYRSAFLSGNELGDDHKQAVTSTLDRLRSTCGRTPQHRRWPFRVDLARFASHFRDEGVRTLLGWIARELTGETNSAAFRTRELKTWLGSWPSILVLDGLDEVTEPAVRDWVIGCVSDLAAEGETQDWDLLLIVTTRPFGYADELPISTFERLDLDELSTDVALQYGHLVTSLRLRSDTERIERVGRVLETASTNPALAHLLRTPLQVQIMSVIAEAAGVLDPDRYSLFWRYYQTVVDREQRKSTGLSELLRDHWAQVLDLHERVGLELQCRSESGEGATASLTESDIRELTWQVLVADGYRPGDQDARLLERLWTAITQRLVLIAPRDGGYGFDVRSLQELMAARRLGTGTLDHRMANLRIIAPSPHWRNTWLFAAGRILVEPHKNEHEELISLVTQIDETSSDRLGSLFPVGPQLAWDLIDDGIAEARPNRLEALARHGLQILNYPAPQRLDTFVGVLVRVAERSSAVRELGREALRDALSGDESSRLNAESLQEAIGELTTPQGNDDVYGLSTVKSRAGRSPVQTPQSDWEAFRQVALELIPPDKAALAEQLVNALQAISEGGLRATHMTTVSMALADRDIAEAVELAVEHLGRNEPEVTETLRLAVEMVISRRPVASMLRED